ncbi:MAG: SOS response-associated peptidase [Oscillospiraceae bacterium]|jgi:putative SOS response-associated peptidase YedK
MCGRYFIDDGYDPEISGIIGQINDIYCGTPELSQMRTGEIFPTDIAPVITARSPALMKWGFSRWDGKGRIINARLETAGERPMFRQHFISRRCLIPASRYFEWRRDQGKKQKYAIGQKGAIYMAGLYAFEEGSRLPLFVILTRPADICVSFIHDRMPVIVGRDMMRPWIEGEAGAGDILGSPAAELIISEA